MKVLQQDLVFKIIQKGFLMIEVSVDKYKQQREKHNTKFDNDEKENFHS